MTTNATAFRHQVFNDSGYILEYPVLADDILQGYPPDPFLTGTVQLFPLGTGLISAERRWRYVYNGAAALVPGYTVQSAASAGAAHDMDMVTAAAAVGDFEITITPTASTSMTKNQYREGYLWTNDLAGEGQCLKIKSHPAITHSTTGVITTYDPVTLALTSSTLTGIRYNLYDNVIVTPHTTLTGIGIGVSDVPVPINYYGWIQTKGPAAVAGVGTLVIGQGVTDDTTTGSLAGSVGPPSAFTERIVGFVMNVGVDGDKSLINLCYE